jgi:Skp family chaperone for outer membrane proteins
VIAVVDVARILKEHKGIQAQVKAVEEELASYDKQFKQQQEELKAAVELLKTLQQGSVDYAKQEEKIANADSSLRLQMNRKRKELVDAEARIYYDNYTMISDAVKLIAEHNKIDLVLRYNSEEMALENQESVIRGVMKNIVYHKDSLDITAYVMQVLDQKMASKQPATATR